MADDNVVEIVKADGAPVLHMDGFTFTPTGLEVRGEPTMDEWARVGDVLLYWSGRLQLAWGQWLLWGERTFGDECWQHVPDECPYAPHTLQNYRWVAERIAPEAAELPVPFDHLSTVAKYPSGRQVELLTAGRNMKVSEFRDYVRRQERLGGGGADSSVGTATGQSTRPWARAWDEALRVEVECRNRDQLRQVKAALVGLVEWH